MGGEERFARLTLPKDSLVITLDEHRDRRRYTGPPGGSQARHPASRVTAFAPIAVAVAVTRSLTFHRR